MGDLVLAGKIGPWLPGARLIDMKAEMEKAKVSKKMMAVIKHADHLAVALEDPATKVPVTRGKGTVTVVGPDGKRAEYSLVEMQGHFVSDVILDKPDRYTFEVRIGFEGTTGAATFDSEIE